MSALKAIKLSDEILQEQIRKTEESHSPHGIFSRRKLNALLTELSEYRRAQPENKPLTPCDLCMYGPPSSGDGKPCTMCPACGKRLEVEP